MSHNCFRKECLWAFQYFYGFHSLISNDVNVEVQSQAHPISGEYTLVPEPVLVSLHGGLVAIASPVRQEDAAMTKSKRKHIHQHTANP